jgi:hypothetical protein
MRVQHYLRTPGRHAMRTALLLFIALLGSLSAAADFTVYPHLMDPRTHPDYARRAVQPPSWDTFENQTQFVCLRGFGVQDNKLVGYVEELEKFTVTHDLGRVVWPSYNTVFAENLGDLANEIKRRGLWLFDPWGYVPGSGPGDYWIQFRVPEAALRTLENTLGERWLGMDVGEQDGRYIGGYASQALPISGERMEQYLHFQRHFQQMGDDLGHRLSTLISLNYGHYLLKEGAYTTIGAETAQALPNSQVYYAFIRGAGKQYGVPWFGNASVFNRFGWKTYGAEGKENGPTKGTSLNLLKRLLYSHILYNCVFVGFENSWFDGDALSPIGRIQQSAQRWVRKHGPAGVMHTPVALLLDFEAGWTFPRHLYTEQTYRVWGNLPYDEGDHFTDGVLGMIYPGYQDASYFHDERGFLSPTPYGDIADVLLSDSQDWALAQYPLVIAAGTLRPSEELRDKLARYVQAGGHLVLTEGNRDALALDTAAPGRGRFTLIPGATGVERDSAVTFPVASAVDAALPQPFRLTAAARGVLDTALREQALFDAGAELAIIVCRKGPGQYTLGVMNNTLAPQPMKIASHCGEITSLTESDLDTSERGAVGEFPLGFESTPAAENTADQIAPAAIRIFDVTVREAGVRERPAITPAPAPKGRALNLGNPVSVQEALLRRPTFFEHFDGALVDWRYLEARTMEALAKEAAWLKRQSTRIYVDLRSGINLYPDLRLTNNDPERYPESIARITQIMDKMTALGATDLIVCLHRQPENSFSIAQTRESFVNSLRALATEAATRKLMLLLAVSNKFSAGINDTAAFVDAVGMENLRLAPSLALLAQQGRTPESLSAEMKGLAALWLVAAPGTDANGTLYTTALPATARAEVLGPWLDALSGAPLALDATYADPDAEYRDVRLVEQAR